MAPTGEMTQRRFLALWQFDALAFLSKPKPLSIVIYRQCPLAEDAITIQVEAPVLIVTSQ